MIREMDFLDRFFFFSNLQSFVSSSLVSVGTEAGVSVQLVQALSSILTAVLHTVIVVQAAVIADVTRRTHTPATQH